MDSLNAKLDYSLHLRDWAGGEICWGFFDTVEKARQEWREIAGRSAEQNLNGFTVQRADGTTVYTGDYVTDEC